MANGVVYAATATPRSPCQAATGSQLWSRELIAQRPTRASTWPRATTTARCTSSTVPSNATVGQYFPNAKGILWALNASTGAPEWSWDEVQNLWGKPAINSGGGQW